MLHYSTKAIISGFKMNNRNINFQEKYVKKDTLCWNNINNTSSIRYQISQNIVYYCYFLSVINSVEKMSAGSLGKQSRDLYVRVWS